MTKVCSKCNELKTLEEFYKDKGFKDGHHSICKVCKDLATERHRNIKRDEYNAYAREYRKTHPEKYEKGRAKSLRLRYGITQEQYNAILASQGGTCALCDAKPSKRAFHTDHRHGTKIVRGILCPSHNRSMALLDDPELMKKAIEYNTNPPAQKILGKA